MARSRASSSGVGSDGPAIRKPPMPHIPIASCGGAERLSSRKVDLDCHARAVSPEPARVLTFLDPGGKPSERCANSEGRCKCDVALEAGEIVSRQPAREPANHPRTGKRAGEADARMAYQRKQPPPELECPLVE